MCQLTQFFQVHINLSMNWFIRGGRRTVHGPSHPASVYHLATVPLWQPWLTCLSSRYVFLLPCNVLPLSLPLMAPITHDSHRGSPIQRGGRTPIHVCQIAGSSLFSAVLSVNPVSVHLIVIKSLGSHHPIGSLLDHPLLLHMDDIQPLNLAMSSSLWPTWLLLLLAWPGLWV